MPRQDALNRRSPGVVDRRTGADADSASSGAARRLSASPAPSTSIRPRGQLAAAAGVAAGLLAIGVAWYWMIFVIVEYGSVEFYSIFEQALVLVYCVASYGACRASWRIWPAARGQPYWISIAASYVFVAIFISAAFITMRAAHGTVSWSSVALNIPFVLLTIHSSIAAVWFTKRYLELQRAAVAARIDAERAAMQTELRSLQQQVDPHFLFNHLNILASFVRSDPDRAEVFLQRLTALYRYLVRHNQAEWVELDEEIAFAESYVHLLGVRFGGAFRVSIAVPAGSGFFVVPGLLQELLNNVVKHNHGSAEHPVDVSLTLDGEQLLAINSLRPKRYAEPRSGHGLATLNERYRLQAGELLAWRRHADQFIVTVPLIGSAP